MTDEERAALKRLTDATLVLIAAARSADEAVQAMTRAMSATAADMPKPPPIEQPEPLPPVDTSSVRALLASLFTADELHRFSRFNTPEVTGRIPWNRTSLTTITFDYTAALERRGYLTAPFFDALVAKVPRREEEIRKVQDEHKAGANAYA